VALKILVLYIVESQVRVVSNMQGIISQIQQDILNSATPLNAIMLKAKVLAYKLGNDEFKQWAKNELDGYENSKDLPDYRIIQAQLFGTL
jgi:hypothetical protein